MSERPVVLATNPIHPEAEARLAEHASVVIAPNPQADTLRRLAAAAVGIIVRTKLPDDILDHAPVLQGMVRHGVGLDFIPV
ncbi:MAG: hydroxyacid dehydrogenase, partial [Gammaproteobacteria bacterium]|nr:hydroxyacid dehydrogenase [Gammaproteobacteria bacterium]